MVDKTVQKYVKRGDDTVNFDVPKDTVTVSMNEADIFVDDIGKDIEFTESANTVCNLPAVATAGNGFHVFIRNEGTGILTIDPDASETIDDDLTLVLLQGQWCWLRCDGSKYRKIFFGPDCFQFMEPVKKTANYTVDVSDAGRLLMADSVSATVTFTLPALADTTNVRNVFAFKNINAGKLAVERSGSDLIDGDISITLGQNNSIILVGDSANSEWRLLPVADGIRSGDSFFNDLEVLGLTTNLKLVLDAGGSDSYPGSGQKWLDLSGNGYDFFQGADGNASTDDPTFNGIVDNLSSNEYFSFDGEDFFTYDSANETWMNNLHKDNVKFTAVMWIYYVVASDSQTLIATDGTTNSDTGIHFQIGNDDKPAFTVRKGSAGFPIHVTADTTISTSAWNLVAVSVDETGVGNSFFYTNGDYNQVSSSNTFNGTYASPSSGNAGDTFSIGQAPGQGTLKLNNNTRVAGVMVWEGAALTKSNLDDIWNQQKSRFSL